MPKKITLQEAEEKTNKCGIICTDGIWRKYTLLSGSYIHPKTFATFICPSYGKFMCYPENLWKGKGGHPNTTKEKIKQTCLVKYGTPNPAQSTLVKEKMEKTNLIKYGTKAPCQNEEIKDKIIKTNQQKYGANSPSLNPTIREKIDNTCIKNYGTKHPQQLQKVKDKMKKTNLVKYGVTNPSNSLEIKLKKEQTSLLHYGVRNPAQSTIIQKKMAKSIQKKIDSGTWFNRFGKEQTNFKNILEKLTNKKWFADRIILGGQELDFYNKDLKLAIEYCGLYWHNEHSPEPRLKNYHNQKRLDCEKQGIRLITIFEDEWLHRNKQVLNFLKSVLGIHTTTIFARKTNFKEITKQESQVFLEENHIQSYANLSKYYFGLFFKEELIAVMTFGKHHRQGHTELVLDRFAVKENYNVVGGASKLFNNALKILPKGKIISWSDNRWSQGNVYKKLGFILEKELPPDYSYIPKKNPQRIRVSKQSQMKSKTGCPSNLKEKEWSLKRGFYRIWDCGKKRWIFNHF